MTPAQVETGLAELQRKIRHRLEILSLQEWARGDPGWSVHHLGKWTIYSHRDAEEWRGSAIGFRSDLWTLMRKKHSSKGLWLRLRHIADGIELWCGSSHFSQGATREVHAKEVHEFLDVLPATTLPVLVGGDMNTPVKWTEEFGVQPVSSSPESKGEYMLGVLQEKGLRPTAPPREQWATPTSRPRKPDAQGRQIDMLASKHCLSSNARIVEDSHMLLGTCDHDAIIQVVSVRCRPARRRYHTNTGPRVVVVTPVVDGPLSQEVLATLARKCTTPKPGQAYRDPEDVKALFRIARAGRHPPDWKKALKARANARQAWTEHKIRAATSGDWGAYRVATKKGATGWEGKMADAMGDDRDPHEEIHDHLSRVYGSAGQKVPTFPFADHEVEDVPDFSEAELHEALHKGKKGVSVGPDKVSHELLISIASTPEGARRILEWFNKLLHGVEPVPTQWSRASMVLIPKILNPTEAKHVRPICIGASASKLFARMLLGRTKDALRYQGPSQSMGEGRQTSDYIFSIARLMQLDQEWKCGLVFLKLDVEKAFDSLNRGIFLQRLATKTGCTRILKCWWSMFESTDAVLSTVWGESVVDMVTGIRQGSVESPLMFAAAMDWILQDVAAAHGWDPTSGPLEGLNLGEVAFVDDLIAWEGSVQKLSVKVTQLAEEMFKWGLRVNLQKCQVYVSPYNTDKGKVTIAGHVLEPDDHLLVMGVPLRVGIAAREALAPVFARVKARFWATKHLFKAKVPLAGRLRLMNRVLGNMALWCAAAFQPDKMALQTINVLQSQIVIWMMRLSKREGEEWLEFRLRTFRASRWAIQRHLGQRWSTQWLRRVWDYAGHRARGGLWLPPTPSGLLDSFRTLEWWQHQQGCKRGARHPARFYPRLMGEERDLNSAAGEPWRDLAMNREGWRSKRDVWVEQQDLSWSSHTQLAIEI